MRNHSMGPHGRIDPRNCCTLCQCYTTGLLHSEHLAGHLYYLRGTGIDALNLKMASKQVKGHGNIMLLVSRQRSVAL